MDMDQGPSPQTYIYGCELTAGKEVRFAPEEDDVEHQLSIRMVCVDPGTKDDLHLVEVEGVGSEGNKVTAVLAALRPSTVPSVCVGGFEITPPVTFRLKAGTGPVHISGQHLVMMPPFDEDDLDDEDLEEEEEGVSLKRMRPGLMRPSKKIKREEDDDEDDDDDDDEDDEDDDEDDEDDEEMEESPFKPKKAPSKPQTPAQNGKSHKPGPASSKQQKTPGSGDQKKKGGQTPNKTPQTPKTPLSTADIKAKMMTFVEKGVSLPKLQPKFENYMKNTFKVTDSKTIEEMWKWRQTVEGK